MVALERGLESEVNGLCSIAAAKDVSARSCEGAEDDSRVDVSPDIEDPLPRVVLPPLKVVVIAQGHDVREPEADDLELLVPATVLLPHHLSKQLAQTVSALRLARRLLRDR